MNVAFHGHMARDAAAVENLVIHGHQINAVGRWPNPNIFTAVEETGGQYRALENIDDAEGVADFVQLAQPDLFYTHFDDSLAAGSVDAIERRIGAGLISRNLLIASPNQASARIEWDKFWLRDILNKIAPEYNPEHNHMATEEREAFEAIDFFEREAIPYVLKPRNPTGGNGVWVKGKHFDNGLQAKEYARKVLGDANQTGLEIQERMDVDKDYSVIGHEFTLQFITDGNVIIPVPATYDYPYRKDGDEDSGTGGMGTFTQADGLLPFLNADDYDEMLDLAYKLLDEMKGRGLDYKGVLYLTAIKQNSGQKKVIEVNARGGDPELVNIIDLFEEQIDYGEVQRLIALGELATDSVHFKRLASAMVYAVSKGYGYDIQPPPEDVTFEFDWDAAAQEARIRFAAGRQLAANLYRTTSTSRIVGFSALGNTPWEARAKIRRAMAAGFGRDMPFDYRQDVADEGYIRSLVLQ